MQFNQSIMTTKGVPANIWKMVFISVDVAANKLNIYLKGFYDENATVPIDEMCMNLTIPEDSQIAQQFGQIVAQNLVQINQEPQTDEVVNLSE